MKKTLALIIVFITILTSSVFASSNPQVNTTIVGNGIGIGSALAIAICWSRTHSVLTTALAGVFGWIYVIYYCIIRERDEE